MIKEARASFHTIRDLLRYGVTTLWSNVPATDAPTAAFTV